MASMRALPSREEVLAALADDRDYAGAGRALGVPPGLAYLVATGLPADGGDALPADDTSRPGLISTSTQHLANPAAENPTSKAQTADWVRRRTQIDGPMQEAAARRTAEPGPPPAPEEDNSVTVVLGRDHGQINALVEELSAIPGARQGGSDSDMSRRQSIVDMISVAASAHEAAEEELFWPRVREVLPDGDELAGQGLPQEQHGAEVLAALAGLSGREDRFDDLVEELVAALRKHVALEDRVFLALEDELGPEELRTWGERVRKAEKAAPTRPHPHAPRRSPAAVKTAGAPTAAMDKVRDAVSSRPADRKGQAEPGLSRTGRSRPDRDEADSS